MSIQERVAGLVGKPSFWIIFFVISFGFQITRNVMNPKLPAPNPAVGSLDLFRLVNHRGRKFGTPEITGTVWVGSVFCTKCSQVDPAIMKRLYEVQHRSRNLGHRFQIVSFSVDPDLDSVDVLPNYAKSVRASARRWAFVTGEKESVRKVIHNVFGKDDYQEMDIEAEVLVPAAPYRVALVDQATQIRGYYDIRTDEGLDELLYQAGLLMNLPYRPSPSATSTTPK